MPVVLGVLTSLRTALASLGVSASASNWHHEENAPVTWQIRTKSTHFPHPYLLLRGVWGRCRDISTFMGFKSVLDCRPLKYSGGSLLRRFASWRNPRRRSGPPPLRFRRRGAPAPPPPPRSYGRAPATAVGGKGERCPALGGGAFLSAGALGL